MTSNAATCILRTWLCYGKVLEVPTRCSTPKPSFWKASVHEHEARMSDCTISTNCSNVIFVCPPTCYSIFHTTRGTFHHLTTLDSVGIALTAAFKTFAFNTTVQTLLSEVLSKSIVIASSRNWRIINKMLNT